VSQQFNAGRNIAKENTRPGVATARPPVPGGLYSITAFVAPTLVFIKLTYVGSIYITEMVIGLLLAHALLSGAWAMRDRNLRKCLMLCGLWLAGQIISDLVNVTAYENYIRGWAKILVIITNIVGIYILMGDNRRRWTGFGLGYALGCAISYYYDPSIYAENMPWKFGLGYCVTAFIVLSCNLSLLHNNGLKALMIASAGALNIIMGFRSLGLICGLTAAFVLAYTYKVRIRRYNMQKTKGILLLISVVVLSGVIAREFYGYVASAGYMGEREKIKYEQQSSGKYGTIIGGRSWLIASFFAIADHPVFGQGSWIKDDIYLNEAYDYLNAEGYDLSRHLDDYATIHSYFLGAWVQAGILGIFLWIWMLWLIYRTVVSVYMSSVGPAPWLIFNALFLLWNILFSALGANQRILAAYQIVLLLLTLRYLSSQTNAKYGRQLP